ncbi:hypothetical protein IWQ61_010316 [Dispira simplex]|nr:hypothetical protein IWQ61_010316 [Dispira simplex]
MRALLLSDIQTDLDGVVRDDVGRKYKAVRLRLEAKDISSTERENAEKARTRRFYDKVKVERRIKRTQRLLKESPEDDTAKLEELEKELHEEQVNLNYTQYFPNLLEYVPLNPNLPIGKDLEELRTTIREEICEAMATDTLESLKEKRRQERLNKVQEEVAKKVTTLAERQKKHRSRVQKDDFFE